MANLQEQQKQPLKELKTSLAIIEKVKKKGEISIYNDEPVTQEVFAENVLKIIAAYPELPDHFFNLLKDRVKDNKLSSKRLTDAVNHVIDTFVYQKPAIANFISFDQNIKVYNHNQAIEYGLEYLQSVDIFNEDDKNRKCFWITKNDFVKYPTFKIWKPKIVVKKQVLQMKNPVKKTSEEKQAELNEMKNKKAAIEKELDEIKAAKKKYGKKLSTEEIMKLKPDQRQVYAKSIVRVSSIKENNLVTELNILKKNINNFTV